MKTYSLPEKLEPWIDKHLKNQGYSLGQPKALAEAVLEVSENYQDSTSTTPWRHRSHWAAYLSYFFPLNYVRGLKVIDEARSFGFFEGVAEVVDFGCGPGTLSKALIQTPELSIPSFKGMDNESRLGALFLDTPRTEIQMSFIGEKWPKISKSSLLVASYALNELEEVPPTFFDFEKILIIEPSTHQAFPRLLSLREQLIEKGYKILAPCPHPSQCPLAHSKKDWCHDRVHWKKPSWFEKLENLLPMKNNTLTMSYLLASRNQSATADFVRIVGDEQKEKGKTRWMICRNENREFLSHLKRQGPAPEIQRGDRVTLDNPQIKGNEVRVDAIHIEK